MSRSLLTRLIGLGLFLLLAWALSTGLASRSPVNPTTPASPASQTAVKLPVNTATQAQALGFPTEAIETLALIKQGGPFPYAKDGTVFQNREGRLPSQARGYYREYTVLTPGSRDRGARRIIAGENGEFYYTDDHYRSFMKVPE